jgi:hypothetical protein
MRSVQSMQVCKYATFRSNELNIVKNQQQKNPKNINNQLRKKKKKKKFNLNSIS